MKLILLHGFTGDPSSWDRVRALLEHEVLCPTILGHGESARDPEIRSFEAEVDRLVQLVEAAGFTGAHLCGYSLGARVALGMLVRHPRSFARATLIGVNPGIAEEARADRARADEAWARMLETEGIERFADAWEAQPLFATQTAEQRAAERVRRTNKDPRELARSLRVLGLAAMPSFWDALQKLPMPVHLIAGERDEKFARIAERMRKRIPQASLTIMRGRGHNVPLEDPAAIAEAIA
jgi:2-succinyl-6-hydroxy-2,4-cyclohexadiene-1-carboxylate synthase